MTAPVFNRVILIVLDSVGIGELPDAAAYGDEGSDTLGNIARAKGMSQLARKAGVGRESLYRALSPDGNPELGTVLKVVRALGLRLHAAPVNPSTR